MLKLIWPIAAVLALSACDSGSNVRIVSNNSDDTSALKVIDALQCPSDLGVLTRRGTASDAGRTCTYTGPRGAEVKLHLVNLDGADAADVLKQYEQQIIPAETAKAANVAVESGTGQNKGDSASVRLPGLKVDADGDRATVRMPGMTIEADGDRANIRIGGLVIRSDENGSQITNAGPNSDNNTPLPAPARASSNSVRANVMQVVSTPGPDGWRVLGYEARGPSGGPVVIATFRLRDRDADDVLDAVRELVAINVGD